MSTTAAQGVINRRGIFVAQKINLPTAADSDSTRSSPKPSIFDINPITHMSWTRVILVTLAGVVSHTFGRGTMPLLLPAIADDMNLSATS